MTRFKKTTLAVATAGILGLGVVGTTQAGVVATSVIRLSDLTFTDAATGSILNAGPLGDFSFLTFTSGADASASLNGTTESYTDTQAAGIPMNLPLTGTGTPPGNDLCVGACPAFGDNTFPITSSAGGAPLSTYAAADQNEFGAPVAGLTYDDDGDPNTPAIPLPTGANVDNASYVSLVYGGDGSATSNNDLSASWIFSLNHAMGITIDFDALAYLEAFVDLTETFPADANASHTLTFAIDLLGGGRVFEWEPDGAAGNITGGTENADAFDLNTSRSLNAPLPISVCNHSSLVACGTANGWSPFSATTNALAADALYQLTIVMQSQANAVSVPEPGILALTGVGLLGLGAARRRMRK